MNKQMKYLAAFVIPHACIINFFLLTIFLNLAAPFVSGYGVDSVGRIYVGENKTINIYHDGENVGSMELKSSNYEFTVGLDDTIIVAYPSIVYRMDVSGNILEIVKDTNAHTYRQIQSNGREICTANGDRYKLVGEFGWTRIIKNDSEVVYRISDFSFAIKCLMIVCAISMYINGILLLARIDKLK